MLLTLSLAGLGCLVIVFKVLERKLASVAKIIEDDYNGKLAKLNAENSDKVEGLILKITACLEEVANDRKLTERKIFEEISKLKMGELVQLVRGLEVKADELGKAYKVALDHVLGFQNLLEDRGNALSASIEGNHKLLSESLDKQKALSENKLKDSHDSIEKKVTVLESALNQEKANLVKSIERSNKELGGYVSKLENALEEQSTSFEQVLISNRKELISQLGDVEKALAILTESTDKRIESSHIEFGKGLKELNKTISDVSKKSDEMIGELRGDEDEIRLRIDSLQDNLNEVAEASKSFHSDSTKQIHGIEKELKSIGSDSQNAENKIEVIQKKLEEIFEAMANQLVAQKASLAKIQKEIVSEIHNRESSIKGSLIGVKKNESLIKKTNEDLENLNSKINVSLKSLEETKTKLSDFAGSYKKEIQTEKVRISKALALGRTSFSGFQMFFKGKYAEDQVHDGETIKKLKKYDESVNRFGFLNGHIYQRFNRNLDLGTINGIIQEWQRTLDVKISKEKLAYMAHKIWLIEGTCSGRLATNVEDEIIRCLIAAYIGQQDGLRGIEIGALFGVNVCCLKELASPYCKSFQLTVVDPLEGYYGKQPNDILVDEPVNDEIFWKNIGRYCKKSEVKLIKKFTYDMDARSFGKHTFNYVLIDGDHSYEGVKVDFELIKNFVEPGGFILFDDYNTTHWPDVKTYVDEAVLTDDNYKEVISMHRTCVVQKLK